MQGHIKTHKKESDYSNLNVSKCTDIICAFFVLKLCYNAKWLAFERCLLFTINIKMLFDNSKNI